MFVLIHRDESEKKKNTYGITADRHGSASSVGRLGILVCNRIMLNCTLDNRKEREIFRNPDEMRYKVRKIKRKEHAAVTEYVPNSIISRHNIGTRRSMLAMMAMLHCLCITPFRFISAYSPVIPQSATRTRFSQRPSFVLHSGAITNNKDDLPNKKPATSHVISDDDEFTHLSTEMNKHDDSPPPTSTNDTVDEHSRLARHDNTTTNTRADAVVVNATSHSSAAVLVPRRASSSLDELPSGRKLDLIWCGGDGDTCRDSIRERVVGDHNHMKFEGPATGQVAFVWDDSDTETSGRSNIESDGDSSESAPTAAASVLFLIRPNDDELMTVAAKAVNELTKAGIEVLLSPDMAAKLKHYYNVDDDMIKLFEPKGFPGFGGSHVSSSDEWMGKAMSEMDIQLLTERNPDLICTLGGDGLLMHASLMFPGPCPPILCVAGGSLGFLTPFSRDEMVEAIKVSLGVIVHDEDGFLPLDDDDDPAAIRAFETMAQHDPYWNGEERYVNEASLEKTERTTLPGVKFGLGNRICLSMRMRLDCRIINREGVVRARFNVLNEVAIDRGSSPYLANLEAFVDNVHLTTIQADGIIFATPTGSTAYSMAAGGSVVHPAVPAILVTPICPHVLSFRSMVFPDSVVLRCYVPDDARSSASVAFDGRYRRELNRGDSVQIQMCHYPVPTINRDDHSSDWLGGLKRSFNFNSRPRQRPL